MFLVIVHLPEHLLDAAVGLLTFAFQVVEFAPLFIQGGFERSGHFLDCTSGVLAEITAVCAQRF